MTGEPAARELLAEITAVTAAVREGTWVARDLGDAPDRPADAGVSGLDSAGLGWLAPFLSFLWAPVDQLSGNDAPVTCGAREYEHASQDVIAAAATYRGMTGNDDYADALVALGESCGTIASALAGAGEVVARAARIVSAIVAEVVAEIVPVMTEAVARSAATFGTSLAEAIPRCVAIAAAAGQRIADTLAALLASGQALLELVAGAVAVMRAARRLLSSTTPDEST